MLTLIRIGNICFAYNNNILNKSVKVVFILFLKGYALVASSRTRHTETRLTHYLTIIPSNYLHELHIMATHSNRNNNCWSTNVNIV